jgi:hypothetical protein
MINQFLKMGGARNITEFYQKFPTEAHFDHFMRYGGGLNRYAPGGPIMAGTLQKAAKEMQLEQSAANGVPPLLARPADQMANFVGPTAPAYWGNAAAPATVPYQGVSIVDMLAAQGASTDKGSRKALAESKGIKNYTGTAAQNRQLIEALGGKWQGGSGTSSAGGKKSAAKSKPLTAAETAEYNNYYAAAHPFVMAPGAPAPINPFPSAGRGDGKTKYNKKSEEYIANDPYFFADEGDNAFIKAIDAPFTWGRNQAAKLVMDGDLGAGAKVVAAGAGAGLLGRAYDYFKPRYEPYTPPGSGSGQRALPSGQRALPSSSTPKQLPGSPSVRQLPSSPSPKGLPSPTSRLIPNYKRNYGGPSHNNSTYSAGMSYQTGGAFIPNYGDAALPIYNQGSQAMYGMGMAFGGPAYSKVTAYNHQQYVPAFDWMQDGGMPQAPQQAPEQGGGQMDPQQMMQQIAQMLQQGAQPQEVLQQLVQMGVPQDQAQQMIQAVLQQMQGAPQEQPPQQEPQPGMAYGGSYEVGGEYEMSENDVQNLIKKGYKIQYI